MHVEIRHANLSAHFRKIRILLLWERSRTISFDDERRKKKNVTSVLGSGVDRSQPVAETGQKGKMKF